MANHSFAKPADTKGTVVPAPQPQVVRRTTPEQEATNYELQDYEAIPVAKPSNVLGEWNSNDERVEWHLTDFEDSVTLRKTNITFEAREFEW